MAMKDEKLTKQEVVSFMNKFRKIEFKGTDGKEIIDFARKLVRYNPYLKFGVQNLDVVEDQNFYDSIESGSLASYDAVNKNISISVLSERRIINGECSFGAFINTIYHEMRHAIQDGHNVDSTVQIGEKTIEEVRALSKSFENRIFTDEQVHDYITLFRGVMSKSFIEEFDKLSPADKSNRCKDIAFSQYLQLKHEEDARETAIVFAEKFFKEMLKDSSLDKETKAYVKSQLEENQKIKENEKRNEIEEYDYFEQFYDAIKDISINEIISKESFLQSKLKGIKGKRDNADVMKFYAQAEIYCDALIYKFTSEICGNKTLDKKIGWLYDCIHFGSSQTINAIINSIEKDESMNEKLRELISKSIARTLSQDDNVLESYKINFGSLLSVSDATELAKSLLQQDKVAFASPIIMNICHKCETKMLSNGRELEQQKKYIKDLMDSAIEYQNTARTSIENGDSVIVGDVNNYCFFALKSCADKLSGKTDVCGVHLRTDESLVKQTDLLTGVCYGNGAYLNAMAVGSLPIMSDKDAYKFLKTYGINEASKRLTEDELQRAYDYKEDHELD